jgi:hypothetical protein
VCCTLLGSRKRVLKYEAILIPSAELLCGREIALRIWLPSREVIGCDEDIEEILESRVILSAQHQHFAYFEFEFDVISTQAWNFSRETGTLFNMTEYSQKNVDGRTFRVNERRIDEENHRRASATIHGTRSAINHGTMEAIHIGHRTIMVSAR